MMQAVSSLWVVSGGDLRRAAEYIGSGVLGRRSAAEEVCRRGLHMAVSTARLQRRAGQGLGWQVGCRINFNPILSYASTGLVRAATRSLFPRRCPPSQSLQRRAGQGLGWQPWLPCQLQPDFF